MILNLSPLMSVIFNIPAAVICAVCRRFLLGRMSRLMVIFLDCCYKGSEKADTMDKRRAPYFVSLRQYPIKTWGLTATVSYTHADLPSGHDGPTRQTKEAQVLELPTHHRSRTEGVHVQVRLLTSPIRARLITSYRWKHLSLWMSPMVPHLRMTTKALCSLPMTKTVKIAKLTSNVLEQYDLVYVWTGTREHLASSRLPYLLNKPSGTLFFYSTTCSNRGLGAFVWYYPLIHYLLSYFIGYHSFSSIMNL